MWESSTYQLLIEQQLGSHVPQSLEIKWKSKVDWTSENKIRATPQQRMVNGSVCFAWTNRLAVAMRVCVCVTTTKMKRSEKSKTIRSQQHIIHVSRPMGPINTRMNSIWFCDWNFDLGLWTWHHHTEARCTALRFDSKLTHGRPSHISLSRSPTPTLRIAIYSHSHTIQQTHTPRTSLIQWHSIDKTINANITHRNATQWARLRHFQGQATIETTTTRQLIGLTAKFTLFIYLILLFFRCCCGPNTSIVFALCVVRIVKRITIFHSSFNCRLFVYRTESIVKCVRKRSTTVYT